MKAKILALFLLVGSTMFAGVRVFVGVGGYYPPAPVVTYAAPPPMPYGYAAPVYARPGYTWIGGYWYPSGPRYYWHAGYWSCPPYAGAYWVGPRYYGHRYYSGYWRR